jgi:hypothetical protein
LAAAALAAAACLAFPAGNGKRHYIVAAVLFAVLCQPLNKLFLFF